ncbi:hypothetical protein [Virgibacillus necropolis]|uniref:Uncharacterized protein n=1 Tax=Virgibacillus necropolis TaxID=163877 RepID=A0A221MC27_9BACI|nr:hypothetical protein [Virgibacillus necropolis]ASN05191.1 hypothetical protein CFK40_09265 [Virgibacillus necropolis]
MEAIFDTLFGNILVLLAIVGGIVGFIKDRNNKEKESTKPYSVPRPTQKPSGGGNLANHMEVTEEQTKSTVSTTSLREQFDASTHRAIEGGEHDAIAEGMVGKSSSSSNKNNRMRKQISNNLSKQGLVNGIIMSEVLGPPRAKRPYRSVLTERRK